MPRREAAERMGKAAPQKTDSAIPKPTKRFTGTELPLHAKHPPPARVPRSRRRANPHPCISESTALCLVLSRDFPQLSTLSTGLSTICGRFATRTGAHYLPSGCPSPDSSFRSDSPTKSHSSAATSLLTASATSRNPPWKSGETVTVPQSVRPRTRPSSTPCFSASAAMRALLRSSS